MRRFWGHRAEPNAGVQDEQLARLVVQGYRHQQMLLAVIDRHKPLQSWICNSITRQYAIQLRQRRQSQLRARMIELDEPLSKHVRTDKPISLVGKRRIAHTYDAVAKFKWTYAHAVHMHRSWWGPRRRFES